MINDDELDQLVLDAAKASSPAPMASKPWELKLVEAVPKGTRFTPEQTAQWELLVLTGLHRLDRAGYGLDHLATDDVACVTATLQNPRAAESIESPALRVLCRLAGAGFVEFNPQQRRVQITAKGRGFLWQQND